MDLFDRFFASKLLLVLLFILFITTDILICPVSAQTLPPRPFDIGWVGQIYQPDKLAGYAAQGVRVMVADGAGWYFDTIGHSNDYFKRYLDEANKYGITVTFKLSHGNSDNRGTPYDNSLTMDQNIANYVNLLTRYASHLAADSWIIGDEPNLDENYPLGVYPILANNPGYYNLTQQYDPGHALIVFCCYLTYPYNQPYIYTGATYAALTDQVAWDYFPGNKGATGVWTSYDSWKFGLNYAQQYNKSYMVWMQGFGANGYRNLTYDEIRYHAFSAVVQGVKKMYFWTDEAGWTNDTMTALVTQMISQIQEIGNEMNTGITNDPAISVSVPDSNQLTYRHGINGSRHVILAMNIANRNSASGTTLTNVEFSLPNGTNTSSITVLDEPSAGLSRTIDVLNNKFTDTFAPFAVHVYTYEASTGVPTATPAAITPGDANGDGYVDGLDYVIWLNHYSRQASGISNGDFNSDGNVDGLDYVIWLNHYGM